MNYVKCGPTNEEIADSLKIVNDESWKKISDSSYCAVWI